MNISGLKKKKAIRQQFPDATLLIEELKLHDLIRQHGNHLLQLLHKTLIEMHATAGYYERKRPDIGAGQTKKKHTIYHYQSLQSKNCIHMY